MFPAMSTWSCWRDPSHTGLRHHPAGWPQCAVCDAAPAYHDRPAWLAPTTRLAVYVPVPGARWAGSIIAARSAIVGDPGGVGERTSVHYEGWVHGTAQYEGRDAYGLWEAGVLHAASRAVTAYPTTACASLPTAELLHVADYDPTTGTLDVLDPGPLEEWLAG